MMDVAGETQATSAGPKGSLRRSFSWVVFGFPLYLASQWGILIAISRLTDMATLGIFGIAFAIGTPLFMAANLGLRLGRSSDVVGTFAHPVYVRLRMITTGVALAILIATPLFIPDYRPFWMVFAILGVAKAIEAQSDLAYGVMQMNERMDQVVRSLLVRGPLTLLIFAGVLYGTRSLEWAITAQVIAWSVTFLLHDRPVARAHLAPSADQEGPEWTDIRQLAIVSVPLGLGALFNGIQNSAPRVIAERSLGLEEAGALTAVIYFMTAAIMLVNAFGHAVVGRLARQSAGGAHADQRKLLMRLALFGLVIGVCGVAGSYILGAFVLSIAYGPAYAAYSGLLVLVMIAAGIRFVASLLGFALVGARQFNRFGIVHAVVAVVAIVASLWGARTHGLEGIGYGLIIAAATQLLFTVGFLILGAREEESGSGGTRPPPTGPEKT